MDDIFPEHSGAQEPQSMVSPLSVGLLRESLPNEVLRQVSRSGNLVLSDSCGFSGTVGSYWGYLHALWLP